MIGPLRAVVLDAPDHRGLADFYARLLGGERQHADEDWARVRTPDGWLLGFQPAPDHLRPRWPGQSAPQQIHLDIQVPDIDAAAARAGQLGASRIGGGETWHVLADPAGHPFCLCDREMTEPARLFAANLDCRDPRSLAAFYAGLFGMQVRSTGEDGAWIGGDEPGSAQVLFQRVAGYRAPRWGDPARPQQLHLEASVPDLDATEPAVLALGAARLPGEGGNWRVYADPAGHPFCLVVPA